MGKAFRWLAAFYLATLPNDTLNERLHIHVIKSNATGPVKSFAKIWLESNGKKNIEVEYSYLKPFLLNELLVKIDCNWEIVIQQVKDILSGKKVKIINL